MIVQVCTYGTACVCQCVYIILFFWGGDCVLFRAHNLCGHSGKCFLCVESLFPLVSSLKKTVFRAQATMGNHQEGALLWVDGAASPFLFSTPPPPPGASRLWSSISAHHYRLKKKQINKIVEPHGGLVFSQLVL